MSLLWGLHASCQVVFYAMMMSGTMLRLSDEHDGAERSEEGHCDWHFSSSQLDPNLSGGEFHTPDHHLPPNTTCNFHIKGRYNELVEVEVRIYDTE